LTSPETVKARRPLLSLPPTVLGLGLVSLLTDFSSEMIYPLLPLFFTTVLGGSAAGLGFMEGLVESIASLLKLVSGRWSDRLQHRKPLVVAGYSLASVARPLIALAANPWHVIGLRVLDRTGKGLRGAPRDALIADAVEPTRRGEAYGLHRAMDNLGAVAGPVTGLLLFPVLFGARPLGGGDFRLLFGIAAVPAVLSVLVLLFLVREAPRATAPRATGSNTGAATLGRPFWFLLAVLVLFTLGNSSDMFLVLRASSAGLHVRDIYLIWALLHVVKTALSTPAGMLSDRVPRRFLIAGGWIVYAAVYLGFGLASSAASIWWLFGVYGIYFALVEGTERALVADLVPASARGTAFGWYNASIGIAAFPASVIFGGLWTWGGTARGPLLAFGLGSALALTAAVLLLLQPRSLTSNC